MINISICFCGFDEDVGDFFFPSIFYWTRMTGIGKAASPFPSTLHGQNLKPISRKVLLTNRIQ